MMDTHALNSIDRNMDMQTRYVKEILGLIDECREKALLDGISETELKQLTEHCDDIAMAANTAKKLVKNMKPLAEVEDAKEKARRDAEEKAKKDEEKKKKAAAKKETATKKKAEAKETAQEGLNLDTPPAPEPPQEAPVTDSGIPAAPKDEDEDMSFLD